MFKYIILLFGLIAISLFSCDRVKRKSHQLTAAVKEQTSRQLDKAFPTYDAYKADTENNKKRFVEHLKTNLSSDISNIYSYGDFMGSDYKVLISFTADPKTIDRIVRTNGMRLTDSKDDDGLFFLEKFSWWDKDKIELLEPYKIGKEGEYWHYLWYDSKSKKAFYEEFSL